MKNKNLSIALFLIAAATYGCASDADSIQCQNSDPIQCVDETHIGFCSNGLYQIQECQFGCNAATGQCNTGADPCLGKTCPANEQCNKATGNCEPAAASQCDESQYPICNDNIRVTCQAGQLSAAVCPLGCQNGECIKNDEQQCNPADYPQCRDNILITCQNGQIQNTPCNDLECRDGACMQPAAPTACNEADYPKCDGNNRLTCAGGQIQTESCGDKVCLSGECTEKGQAACNEADYPKCDGNNRLTCAGGQIQTESCGDKVCLSGECTEKGQAACNEADYPKCDGNNRLTCTGGQVQSESCGDKVCLSGECTEKGQAACNEADYPKCDGNNRLTCVAGKIQTDSCGTKTCTEGECRESKPECVETDYPKCDDQNNRLTCESGKIVKTSCKDNTCTNGTCVFVPECSDADYPKCGQNNDRLTCVEGKIVTASCGTDQTCKNGVCEDKPCTPKETTCKNGKVATCNANKTWDLQSCKSGEICQAGECVAHGTTPEITECQALTTPGNACQKTGSGKKLVLRGDVLGLDKTYVGGSVVVENGKITYVGCEPDLKNATVITCPDSVISPAFINGHEHITYSNGEPAKWGAERYDHRHEWRKGKDKHTKIPGPQTTANNGNSVVEIRSLMAGTTSIFGSGSAPGLARNLDIKNSAVGGVVSVYETFPLNDNDGTTYDSGCPYNYKSNAIQMDLECPYGPHIAEGINQAALNELRCLSGQGNKSIDIFKPNVAVIHGIGATLDIIKKMAANNVKLIWSPRTNISLYGDTAQAPLYDRMGVTLGLGTDWLYSGSANMLRELKCVDYLNQNHYSRYFSDYEIWKMPTWNNAVALGVDKHIGKIEKGYLADLVMFKTTKTKDLYRAVIEADNQDVLLVTLNGTRIFGEAALMDSGSPVNEKDCQTNKVFDFRAANAKAEIVDYEFIKKSTTYGMFFCNEPPNEPTCVPQRTRKADTTDGHTTLYTGDYTDQNDADGDGINDDKDNCPTMFNPIRPMETDRKQTDTDGDGYGDICDPYPDCKANDDTCATNPPSPTDTDKDGIPDATDNCPNAANPAQTDTDGDKLGDECDPYPECAANNESCNPATTDADNDGIDNTEDNCPNKANPDQADADGDTIGDVCDFCPNGDDGCAPLNSHTVDFSCESCKPKQTGYTGVYQEQVDGATFKAVGNYQTYGTAPKIGVTLTGNPTKPTRIDVTGIQGVGSVTVSYISYNPTGGQGTFDIAGGTFVKQITHTFDKNNVVEVTSEPFIINDSSLTGFSIIPTPSTKQTPSNEDNRVHITKVTWTSK